MKKMKSSVLFLTVVMLMSTMTFQSCSKYDEGPTFSLLSKKSRLVNKWKVDNMLKNGETYTQSEEEQKYINASTFEFKDDNTYVTHTEITSTEGGMTANLVIDVTFTWAFDSGKENVLLTNGKSKYAVTYSSGGETFTQNYEEVEADYQMKIIKLKSKELTLKDSKADEDGDVYTIEFIPV